MYMRVSVASLRARRGAPGSSYIDRIVIAGSIRAARSAGIQQAKIPIAAITTASSGATNTRAQK
jgi:hypothetical protein